MAYKQAAARRKKLVKTYRATKNSCGSGVWYDEERGFFVKYYASNTPGYTKSLRKASNKKVRNTEDIADYGAYKKIYDYKWILF